MVFMDFSGQGAREVELDNATFSTISGCTFNNDFYGIVEQNSPGGNSYNNNTFVKTPFPLWIIGSGNVLKFALRSQHCFIGLIDLQSS